MYAGAAGGRYGDVHEFECTLEWIRRLLRFGTFCDTAKTICGIPILTAMKDAVALYLLSCAMSYDRRKEDQRVRCSRSRVCRYNRYVNTSTRVYSSGNEYFE